LPKVNEDDLWLLVFWKEEVRERDWINAFVHSAQISKPTLLKRKKVLLKEGKIKEKMNEKGEMVYYVPSEMRSEADALASKRGVLAEIANLPLEKQVEIIQKLRNEEATHKRQLHLRELRDMPLPLTAVATSLQKRQDEFGWRMVLKKRGRRKIGDAIGPQIFNKRKRKVTLTNTFYPDPEHEQADILFKIVPQDEYPGKYLGGPWRLLFLGKIKNQDKALLGAYEELLEIENSEFEKEWLSWKGKLNLTKEEWWLLGPHVREMMLNDFLSEESFHFLAAYAAYKTSEGEAAIKALYQRRFGKKKGLEIANKEIEEYHKLRGKTQI